MRSGAEYFTEPGSAAQRRYEALRAYFVEEATAAQVADRYGYSTVSVHQMATLLRTGKLAIFTQTKPGPKGPRKAVGPLRARVLALRADDHSVTEIAAALAEQGTPISAQTVWQILDAEGLPRLPRRDETPRGSPVTLASVKAAKLETWPASAQLACNHAGLLLLLPGMVELGLHQLVAGAGYHSTRQLSAWQSIGTLLLAKCARRARTHHIDALTDDAGLAFTLGLSALPRATHLGSYSWRVRRTSNQQLLSGLVLALRRVGLATGEAGFNLDFHAIRHHGEDPVLEKHYVPRRSQRTRAVLSFFAQDHTSTEMVYANADLTKAELARPAALPASAWKHVTIDRAGRYRRPHLHEDMIQLKDIDHQVRQIAIGNIGRDQPTLLITADLTTPAKTLFTRYAERMIVENQLDAYISGFHLDALTSSVSLNVDLDTTLTVAAGIYRMLARNVPRYQTATPETIWRHFLDATGTLHITDNSVTCALKLRSRHPILIDAGFADLESPSLVGQPHPPVHLPPR